MDKDLYEILGLKKTATEAEIKKSFRQLAKKYHPDVNPNDKVAEQKFKEVNLAYEVLKDAKKRAHYDQMRALGANPFARGEAHAGGFRGAQYSGDFGDMGLGDLFEEIFGGKGGFTFRSGGFQGGQGFGGRRGGFSSRGADQEAPFNITFLEAARGAERTIELENGKRISVKIPEGVETGSKIKLSGLGGAGHGGGPAGDLILSLSVSDHPYFSREKENVVLKLPITVSEAILGAEIEIPTVDGRVHLKVPRGVSSGQRMKLTGKGIKVGGQRGDQFVEILIKVPKEPSAKYKEAADTLKSDNFNPRSNLF